MSTTYPLTADGAAIYPKQGNLPIASNFNSNEFDCHCQDCKVTIIHPDLIIKLQKMRDEIGTKLSITSGYRCPNYQAQLRLRGYETAKGVSQHTKGMAADLTNGVANGAELESYAREASFKAVGVGKNWIHVDLRDDLVRRWFYSR